MSFFAAENAFVPSKSPILTAVKPAQFEVIKLIWRTAPHTQRRVVGTLRRDGDSFSFRYDGPDLEKAKAEGFRSYPGMTDLERTYNGQAMVAFSSRLPSRERPDLDHLLGGWGADSSQDNFQILGLTFGRLPTDMYEFIPEIQPVAGTRFFSDLAGIQNYQHSEAFRHLRLGAELNLQMNPRNEHDCRAVEVHYQGQQVGHLKRIHCESVCAAIESGLDASCHLVRVRLNGVIQEVVVEIAYT